MTLINILVKACTSASVTFFIIVTCIKRGTSIYLHQLTAFQSISYLFMFVIFQGDLFYPIIIGLDITLFKLIAGR